MADPQDVGSSVPTVPDNQASRTVIADHELLQRVGEGSYGEVWLARSVLGEYRAVKIVHRSRFQEQRPYEREFRGIQKFEPISRAHESQVDILHVGRDDAAGYFYYIMDPADDLRSGQAIKPEIYCPKTLKNVLVEHGRLTFAETLHIGLNLVGALEHLHQNNLVHRDIKPSNIIFINGTPKLADIGLVAEISEARSFVGTEGFIPPEGPGTVQADIYSLGKVLYLCCLAQKDKPFPDLPDNFEELPDKARLLELNEVILKACETDLRTRYETTSTMRADLLLLQGGKSVKRLRLVERRLAVITRASIVMTCLAILTSALAIQISRQKTATTRRLVRSHVDTGTRLMNEGDNFGALLWFAEALKLDAGNPSREENHRIRIASVLRQCPKLVGIFVHDGAINQAALSPDGHHVATASDDHTAAIWDLVSGARLFSLPHESEVYQVVFSPDGKRIATAERNDLAHVWDAVTGKPLLANLKHRRVGSGILRFSADGERLATVPESDEAQIWDLVSGQALGSALRHHQKLLSLAFSPNGKQIVTTTGERNVWLWDAASGAPLPLELKSDVPFVDACFSPDGRNLATTSDDTCVRLWTYPEGQFLAPPMRHHHWIQSICFSPQGDRLLSTAQDKTAQIWSVATHNSLVLPLLHTYRVVSGEFTPDGRGVVTASGGIYARVWSAVTGEPLTPPLKHYGLVRPGNISADGRLIITVNRDQVFRGDQAVRVWDMANANPLTLQLTPVFHPHEPKSPNGRLKVSLRLEKTGLENTARVLEVISGRPTTPPLRHNAPLRQALFSSDSKLLVTETLDSRARIWDPETGEALGPALRTKYVPGGRLFGGHVGELRWPTRKDLPHDPRPTQALLLIAELMSGNRIDPWGGVVPLYINDVTNYWARIKADYPKDFCSSPQETIAWHDREAKTSESDGDWWAARFHLDQLLKLQPGDVTMKARQDYAQLALDQEIRITATNGTTRRFIPPRDPQSPANLIDLSSYYNGSLQGDRGSSVEISDSPSDLMGLQTLLGVQFDIRGIVQLSESVGKVSIKIGRKCQQLHFLHASRYGAKDGTQVGKYVLHFESGEQKEIAILYGRDVRAWRMGGDTSETSATQRAFVAWMGVSPAAKANVEVLRIFKTTLENPLENQVITSIEFVNTGQTEPFLVALTLD